MAFGVTVNVSLLVVNLKANMEYAQSHEWGRKFRVSGHSIYKKYPDYSHKYDQTLYDDMIQEYAAADCVRVLQDAPAPSKEQSNLVGGVGRQLAALQRAFGDYKESAYLVNENSYKRKKKESNKKKKDTESQRGRGSDSKSKSSKQKARGCSKSTDRHEKNKCKHCKESGPYAGKHEASKCFYNMKYKGWQPSKICKELDVTFKC